MCWWKSATAAWPTTSSAIGHNFEAVLGDLETRMREAAADLNFEEAARLRDEVKRLRATELAVVDDPTVKQRGVQRKAGAYAGTKKYGESANLPRRLIEARRQQHAAGGAAPRPSSEGRRRGPRVAASKVHKPHLDEMHGPESLPYRPDGARPRKPSPTIARQRQQDLPAHRLAAVRARSSAPRRAPAAARRGIGVGGRSGGAGAGTG